MSASHREVSLVLTCWCSCSRLCSGTYWMWPVSGCNVYSSGYSDFDNVALFAASLQLLHRFTLFSPKTNSAQFNSVFRVFHYVVIPGTRNFFFLLGRGSKWAESIWECDLKRSRATDWPVSHVTWWVMRAPVLKPVNEGNGSTKSV